MAIAHAVKCFTLGAPTMLFGGKPRCRAGADRTTFAAGPQALAPAVLELRSEAFDPGQPIPRRYTADGENLSPPLRWASPPVATRSLALITEDPDAPLPKPYVHWLVYNILPSDTDLPEGVPAIPIVRSLCVLQGRNSSLRYGYTGAAPPKRDVPHRYHFQLYALDAILSLQPGVGRSTLLRAIAGHVLAKGELVGTYRR